MSPLSGILNTYETADNEYPYFTSGDLSSHKAVVFIGGLTNGIGEVSYISALSDGLGKAGWKLVQMHWSSAYDGYMTGSLDRDIVEMSDLVSHLRQAGTKTIIIMGHSTGSQDVMHYLTSPTPPFKTRSKVDGGIMQAPVSDRQFVENAATGGDEGCKALLEALGVAIKMREEGRGRDMLDEGWREKLGGRFIADRLFSLYGVGGLDDYFSTDLPTDPPQKDEPPHTHPLAETFAKLPVPSLTVYSKQDQYAIGNESWKIMDKWKAVSHGDGGSGMLDVLAVEGDHDISDESLQGPFVDGILGWLGRF